MPEATGAEVEPERDMTTRMTTTIATTATTAVMMAPAPNPPVAAATPGVDGVASCSVRRCGDGANPGHSCVGRAGAGAAVVGKGVPGPGAAGNGDDAAGPLGKRPAGGPAGNAPGGGPAGKLPDDGPVGKLPDGGLGGAAIADGGAARVTGGGLGAAAGRAEPHRVQNLRPACAVSPQVRQLIPVASLAIPVSPRGTNRTVRSGCSSPDERRT
ncbi:hypothetical protein Acsp07_13030 [Actinomycetospora sp. NBRC 106378]|nr:hypothetical protein Acsp07_13030 [Actinomycetospora sp. NBRC 106378]